MNRSLYFDYIEEKLSILATRITLRGHLNVLNLNLHAEDFYVHLFNELFDWQLVNSNAAAQNTAAIDLVDPVNKIVAQVSATATKTKVESALMKDLSAYSGYTFKFISISKDASGLTSNTFKNPHKLFFDPAKDVYDLQIILRKIIGLNIVASKRIYDLIEKELGGESNPQITETNLANIIGVLAKENLSNSSSDLQVNAFEVERKIEFNKLNAAKDLVEDHKVHYSRLDRIYSEFDKSGANKTESVLGSIRAEYTKNRTIVSDDLLFFEVVRGVINKVQHSANFIQIPLDELELCAAVLVVDAFIRCKIFLNPENYNHAVA